MKKLVYLVCSFIATTSLLSCSDKNSMSGLLVGKINEAVKLKTEELKKLPEDETLLEGEEMTFDVSVSMDTFQANSLADSLACALINQQLVTKLLGMPAYTPLTQAITQFIEKKKEEFRQEEYMVTCYDHITGTADPGLDGVVNYTFREDYYGGGAHPTQVVTIKRFNTQTGTPIELWDVFEDSCSHTLCNMLTQRLMDMVQAKNLDELKDRGYLEMVDMFIPQNFWLDRDSISFFFNQYDIAPYALGQTSISFSYKELQHCLRPAVWESVR